MKAVRILVLGTLLALLATVWLLAATIVSPAEAGPPVFYTICHVAGLASDPANYITLTLPEPAVFGPAGHFNEEGTPQAGHEQDYFGACVLPTEVPSATPTSTEVPSLTPTPIPPTETATEVPADTLEPTATPTLEATPTVGRTRPTDNCIPGGGTEFAPCETPTPPEVCTWDLVAEYVVLLDTDAPQRYWGRGDLNGLCLVKVPLGMDNPAVSVERQAAVCSICATLDDPAYTYRAEYELGLVQVWKNCQGELRYTGKYAAYLYVENPLKPPCTGACPTAMPPSTMPTILPPATLTPQG